MVDFIQGRDVFAIMPTGSGKSVTFQVPALLLPGITVVVSPLVALIRDQVRQLGDAGLQMVGALYSGQAPSERADILRGARAGRYRLVYVSPERLWSPEFRSALAEVGIQRLVVDEAHCISQWGQSFRTEYSSIPEAIEGLIQERRPTILAATATATPRVAAEIQDSLHLNLENGPITGNPDRPEIEYHLHRSASTTDRDVDVLKMVEAFLGQPTIVYVPSRATSARLGNLLRFAGHNAASYHAGLTPERRKAVEERFLYGDVDVVVGTKAFGLGINKDNIALIVHYEMPASIEEFIQETGRLARGAIWGGEPKVGTSILISAPRDCSIHKYFIDSSAPDLDLVDAIERSLVDGENYVSIADQAKIHQKEELQVELALYYLHLSGVVSLGQDRASQARVVVPSDAVDVLRNTKVADPQLARRVVRFAKDRPDFEARQWAEALEISVEELEDTVLELQRRDVMGFYPWSFSKTVHRNPGATLDRGLVENLARERVSLVAGLSKDAKDYARHNKGCRRRPLLSYLGVAAPATCGGCDNCIPLEKPWAEIEVTIDSLFESLPVHRVIESVVNNAGIYGFSEQNYIRCLLGDKGFRGKPLPDALANDPAFGVFRPFGKEAVERSIEEAVTAGVIERVEKEFNDTKYYSLRAPGTSSSQWRS